MAADTASALDTAITIVGFIATIASLVLAIGAIWLSFVFYKMSNEASKETTKAAKDIQSSVERLEKIFDKLYSDTFSMMKDTVTDMRQHIWKKPQPNSAVDAIGDDEKINALKNSISREIIGLVDEKLKSSEGNEVKIKELEDKIKRTLESGIQKTMRLQALPSALIRRRLLGLIRRNNSISLDGLIKKMNAMYPEEYSLDDTKFINNLFSLRESGAITWDGPSTRISTSNILTYVGENKEHTEKD
ncbi:TPA: hypothetical protein ACIAH1_004032 [Enterobacter hormaechei subsp. steigerwaltii]